MQQNSTQGQKEKQNMENKTLPCAEKTEEPSAYARDAAGDLSRNRGEWVFACRAETMRDAAARICPKETVSSLYTPGIMGEAGPGFL